MIGEFLTQRRKDAKEAMQWNLASLRLCVSSFPVFYARES